MNDTGAASTGSRVRLFTAGAAFALVLLAAGSTRLSDPAPYAVAAQAPAFRMGDDEVIHMVQPGPRDVHRAAYRLFGERKPEEDGPAAHRPLMVTSVCLTSQDAFAHRLLVCSIRNSGAPRIGLVKTGRIGRIR